MILFLKVIIALFPTYGITAPTLYFFPETTAFRVERAAIYRSMSDLNLIDRKDFPNVIAELLDSHGRVTFTDWLWTDFALQYTFNAGLFLIPEALGSTPAPAELHLALSCVIFCGHGAVTLVGSLLGLY